MEVDGDACVIRLDPTGFRGGTTMRWSIVGNRPRGAKGFVDYVGKAPAIKADLSRFPHECPRCKSPAYVGAVSVAVDCTNTNCATKKR